MNGGSLTRYAWLSVATAVATIALKAAAWWLTGSVGLLSDALESGVNLVAALMALWMLTLAERPPDEEHAYGYSKAEYFSSGAEGGMIFLAAGAIIWSAVPRLIDATPIESVGPGLVVSLVASAINLGTAWLLMRAGRRHGSITLEADAHHLMTDVWTSAGVIVGVGLVALTGWYRLDALVAILVALNILRIGFGLVRRSALGLLDRAISATNRDALQRVLSAHERQGVTFHALRTREAAGRSFASVHVLVPGHWSVQRGHDLCDRIEREMRNAVPRLSVITHLEPLEDPRSFEDDLLGHEG